MHIQIKVPENVPVLCFRESGYRYWEEQLRKVFDQPQLLPSYTVEFPPHVRTVSASFLYGMFHELEARIGIDGIILRVNITGLGMPEENLLKTLTNEIKRNQ